MAPGRAIAGAAWERVGQQIGNYRIAEPIGEGGMGVVYVAEHALIGRRVAVKVLRPELSRDPETIARFFNEARAAAMLKHPGIVEVYDYGYCPDGSAYIVMELLSGESLSVRLERFGPMPESLVVALMRQIASAVGVVHAAGIIHRDLKPDNVHLCPDADAPHGLRARILDFGIAKLSLDHEHVVATQTGKVFGSPLYMSPEQFLDTGKVDQRADVYSLGCVAFEMACGRPPFVAAVLAAAGVQHLLEPPPGPRTLAPELSPRFEGILLRTLAKAPEERYASMADLVAALDGKPAPAPQEPARRGKSGLWIAGAVLVVGGVFGGYVLWSQRAETPSAAIAVAPEPAAPPSAPRAAPPASAPAGAPAVSPAPGPAVSRKVSRRVVSHPAGASIYRSSAAAPIGTTPFVEEAEAQPGEIQYQLRLAGYRDETVTLSAERDGTLEVNLKRKLPERPSTQRPSGEPPPAERPRAKGDPIDVFGEKP